MKAVFCPNMYSFPWSHFFFKSGNIILNLVAGRNVLCIIHNRCKTNLLGIYRSHIRCCNIYYILIGQSSCFVYATFPCSIVQHVITDIFIHLSTRGLPSLDNTSCFEASRSGPHRACLTKPFQVGLSLLWNQTLVTQYFHIKLELIHMQRWSL